MRIRDTRGLLRPLLNAVRFFAVILLTYLIHVCIMPEIRFFDVKPNLVLAVMAVVTVGFEKLKSIWYGLIMGILLEVMQPTTPMLSLLLYPIIAALSCLIFADKSMQRLEYERGLGKPGRNKPALLRTPLCAAFDAGVYEAVNIAAPSLIRTESDELTYSLHILIRYEIEKELVNGRVTVDEVPALWNAKYKEYLGVDVPDDARGCLQDVHWSGNFGYFPSYALGNAYGVQILRTMEKDFDVFAAVEKGELSKVADWLREHVFSIASLMDPDEWIRAITGEGLNVDYFLTYLEEKFTALYDLK